MKNTIIYRAVKEEDEQWRLRNSLEKATTKGRKEQCHSRGGKRGSWKSVEIMD